MTKLRLAARERPEVVDHRVDASVLGLDDLQVGLDVRQLAEPRPDAGVAAAARDVDRVEVVARDLRAYQTASRRAAS